MHMHIYKTASYLYNENYNSSCFTRPLENSTTMPVKCLICSLSHRKNSKTTVIIMVADFSHYTD